MSEFKMGNLEKPNTDVDFAPSRDRLLRSLNLQKEAFDVIVNIGHDKYEDMVGCFAKEIRPWWFRDPNGVFGIRVYCGSHLLDVNGCSDVVVGKSQDDVPAAIDWLIDEVKSGTFDNALTRVANEEAERHLHHV